MTRKEWLSSGWMRVCAARAASFCVEKNAKYEGEAGPAHTPRCHPAAAGKEENSETRKSVRTRGASGLV